MQTIEARRFLFCVVSMRLQCGMSRKSKKVDGHVRILLDAIQSGMPVNLACDFAQIGRTTFYEWHKSDSGFRTQIAYAKSKAIREFISLVAKKDPWKILKNLAPEDFKDYRNVVVDNSTPIDVVFGDGRVETI